MKKRIRKITKEDVQTGFLYASPLIVVCLALWLVTAAVNEGINPWTVHAAESAVVSCTCDCPCETAE